MRHMFASCLRAASAFADDMGNVRIFLEDEAGNWAALGLAMPQQPQQQQQQQQHGYSDGSRKTGASLSLPDSTTNLAAGGVSSHVRPAATPAATPATALRSEGDGAGAGAGAGAGFLIRSNIPAAAPVTARKSDTGKSKDKSSDKERDRERETLVRGMLQVVELPEAPTDCLHPLDELGKSALQLAEPWNVFTVGHKDFAARTGKVVPLQGQGQVQGPERVESRVPQVYVRLAGRGFI